MHIIGNLGPGHIFFTIFLLWKTKIQCFLDRERGSSVVSTLGENAKFVEVDIDNKESLEAALHGE